MKAVGYHAAGPIDRPDALVDLDLPTPVAGPRDLIVRVHAVSVNPVDTKVRAASTPAGGSARVLGFDAAGVVETVGSDVTLFKPGDEVFYAGDITRPGTNSEWHAIDERLVGRKPESLDWAAAAAVPLTAITAWEALFSRLDVSRPVPGANGILIVGSGGVGSIAIQLAKQLTELTIVGTAALPEGGEAVRALGADHVVDYRQPLDEAVAGLGIAPPGFVFSTTHTDQHLDEIVRLIAAQGRIAFIDDPAQLDIVSLKPKMLSANWEFMFGRSMFQTVDMIEQHKLLEEVARLIDAGRIVSSPAKRLSPICADTLREAHALVESGKAGGKIVIEGWH
ncbi:zinc-binding alcohol dehydrogenase family protein [Paraburkholderia sp. J12]|uniref:zinc-binding alcohol dehydrogenase family protein n=1 Tax=Paraburkholderia sp. J12 TaxID=2805432 RepID=UPI002ABE6974|nr:zinc-binding alcohol dehydrogenase family protein [Paraburkholderia sp. J12]